MIYTARGMRNLEIMTDAVVVGKYRVLPQQYADYATLRGDASDGLPGVAGIGEKTAAALLGEYGTLDGLLAAAADAGSGLSASVRSKLAAAADYLKVAPDVVNVVRDLDAADARASWAPGCTPSPASHAPNSNASQTEWNLGGSVRRLLEALDLRR